MNPRKKYNGNLKEVDAVDLKLFIIEHYKIVIMVNIRWAFIKQTQYTIFIKVYNGKKIVQLDVKYTTCYPYIDIKYHVLFLSIKTNSAHCIIISSYLSPKT